MPASQPEPPAQRQLPPEQLSPPEPQPLPQVPQLSTSLAVRAQAPPQQAWSDGQASPPQRVSVRLTSTVEPKVAGTSVSPEMASLAPMARAVRSSLGALSPTGGKRLKRKVEVKT